MSTQNQQSSDTAVLERARRDTSDRFHCKTNSEVLENYRQTAVTYEESVEAMRYKGPTIAADALDNLQLDKTDISILDVGAGTGLVGMKLSELGYTKMDAVDGSAEMLQQAKQRGIYTEIMCHDVNTSPMPIKENTYDVAIIAGCFTKNSMDVKAMDDIIRVVRPGGYVVEVSSIREWAQNVFYPYLAKLEEQQLWLQVSRTIVSNFYDGKPGCLKVYKIL